MPITFWAKRFDGVLTESFFCWNYILNLGLALGWAGWAWAGWAGWAGLAGGLGLAGRWLAGIGWLGWLRSAGLVVGPGWAGLL